MDEEYIRSEDILEEEPINLDQGEPMDDDDDDDDDDMGKHDNDIV